MPKTITLSQVKIVAININIEAQMVEVFYELQDENGKVWDTDNVRFVREYPTGPEGEITDGYIQLESKHFVSLAGIVNRVQTLLNNQLI